MKFTLSWLKDHLDTNVSLNEISDKLTAIGLEVESVSDRSKELQPFTVAKILHAEKHPEADKLRVCKVQSDVGELQIVCGAPNARAGIFVALAKEGAVIPASGMVIKKTKIRGVESNGMLCSADELSIGGDADGIIELPEAPIGSSVAKLLGLEDPVIEIAITPNRGDALGVRGIARDLAAAGLGILKPLPDIKNYKGSFNSSISINIASSGCHQFIGCTLRGVKNGPSPAWLQQRLQAIGLRPISALVDITNYITFDLGRPLHVYDAKKLHGNIAVRPAKAGERIKALDDKEYTLMGNMIVIADDKAAVAVGGIIGGLETGCSEGTTDVFLEVALFEPDSVAKAGRALQLQTDARYRFERGVDVNFVEPGALHAIRMIKELCGGESSNLVIAGKIPEWQCTVLFDTGRVKSLGGVAMAASDCKRILSALGFGITDKGTVLEVAPPSWRSDIESQADLVEEVLRIRGYDHIPPTPLPTTSHLMKPASNVAQKRAGQARRLLASRGFLECCTWSFLPDAQAKLFGGGKAELKLANPISADLDTMRPSMLPNLLEAAKKNKFRGIADLLFCEIGFAYHDASPTGQRMVAAGIRVGHHTYYVHGEQFETCTPPLDAFDIKSDALAVLQCLGMSKADITTDTPSWYHPGRSGALTLGGKVIMGHFGELHPSIVKHYDLESQPVVAFEIFLDAVPQSAKKTKTKPALRLSDYQAVTRDFAFIVDEAVTAADIIRTLGKAEKQLVTGVDIFDVYAGKGVDNGKKSVAVNVTLQAMDRTLSDDEITTVSKAIVSSAEKGFGGKLRQ